MDDTETVPIADTPSETPDEGDNIVESPDSEDQAEPAEDVTVPEDAPTEETANPPDVTPPNANDSTTNEGSTEEPEEEAGKIDAIVVTPSGPT